MSHKLPRITVKCKECNNDIITTASVLSVGRGKFCSRSCSAKQRSHKHGYAANSNNPTYNTWAIMKQRCTNPKNPKFYLYGARGITVCDKWLTFSGFLEDMGERPKGTTIDRIDNAGNYELSNCRWATIKTQQRNLRTNLKILYNGCMVNMRDIADKYSISVGVLNNRLLSGWNLEDALNTPVKYGNWKLRNYK